MTVRLSRTELQEKTEVPTSAMLISEMNPVAMMINHQLFDRIFGRI
jgi:hypothetical protein